MDMFELGDFPLTTGITLPNATLSYMTHGTLSPAKDNAILFPHFLGGASEALAMWIGEGRALDPGKYFIILPGQFGNGASTSPSNTPAPFNAGAFPAVKFADDVIAQHKLVTEHLGIDELQLVLGWSTGALQTFEWAVRYADTVKRIASIAGAPMPSPWTRLWLRTVLESPITSDPAWSNGFYADPQAVQAGMRRLAHGTALTLPPPWFYSESDPLWRSLGFTSMEDSVSRFWEAFWLPQDPNNVVVQVRKALAADPSDGGDRDAALRRISAKALVIAFTGDPMFQPDDCEVYASKIPNSEYRKIISKFGHLATFALSEQDVQQVDDALRELLAS